MYDETRGKIHFWARSSSTSLLPMHFLGLAGMPRRYADYPMQFTDFNTLALTGVRIRSVAGLLCSSSLP
jgi:cytochrome c oxidase subunit 1